MSKSKGKPSKDKQPKAEQQQRQKAAKKSREPKAAPRAPLSVPQGPSPTAGVHSRYEGSMHERPGRGFSRGELAAAGVPEASFRRFHLSIDLRRRSVLEENVEALKSWLGAGTRASAKAAN